MQRRQFLLAITAASLIPLSGCNLVKDFKDMFKGINEVRDELNKKYGVAANVNVRVVNGVKTVTVQFVSAPPGNVGDIKQQVTEIVERHMDNVSNVTIMM